MDNIKKAFDIWPEFVITNINDVINYLKSERITELSFDKQIIINNKDVLLLTDKEHPFLKKMAVLQDIIDENFYNKYKDRIEKVLEENKKRDFEERKEKAYSGEQKKVHIDEDIYDEKLIRDLVKKNPKTRILFSKNIAISENLVNYLKKHHIDAIIKPNETLSKSTILGNNDYYEIINNETDFISVDYNSPLEEVKYVSNNIKVEIAGNNSGLEYSEYFDKVYNLVRAFRDCGYTNEITINCTSREALEKSPFKDGHFSNILVNIFDEDIITLERFLKEGEILQLMKNEINKPEYSPFEKFCAAFNLVKQYKEYKENFDDKSASRNISKIIDNEYMVCAGYGNMFRELLNRIGINCMRVSINPDESYNDGFTMEEKPLEYAGHDRTLVYIDDPKYNIHGAYFSDPTWDNDLEKDYYNHTLISFDKTGNSKSLIKADQTEFLLNAHDENEWHEKLTFYLNRKVNENLNKNKLERNNENVKKAIMKEADRIVTFIMLYFEKLNPDVYNAFKDRMPNSIISTLDNYDEFFKEISKVIVSMVGKDIPLEMVVKAGMVSRSASIPKKDLLEFEKQVLLDNKEREKIAFPYLDDEDWKQKAR